MIRGTLRLFCILGLTAAAGSAFAAPVTSFPSVTHCVRKGRFKAADCSLAFYAARRIYSERVATYLSREACTKIYKTCVIYNSFPVARRLDPGHLRYAPPFLGIAVASENSLDSISALVGVERQGINIGVAAGLTAPKPALGYFESTPAAQPQSPPEAADNQEQSVIIDGALFSDPLPGQVLTYPVPKHLMPKRIPDGP